MAASTPEHDAVTQRATTLLLVAVIGLAIIGFFVGLDDGVPGTDTQPLTSEASVHHTDGETVLPAMSYAEIGLHPIGAANRAPRLLDSLRVAEADPFSVTTIDQDDKLASLSLRSERRAFNGAPPIIPHSVNQLDNASCLICHGEGFKIENRTAKQLPHSHLENCMQCHAPPAESFFASFQLATNSFDGIAAPLEGERAWAGAPPVIPHTTWMRTNCQACHGPNGWPGMESTHPWRQNCLQCHAPSSTLDLNPRTLTVPEFVDPPPVRAP